MNVLDLVLLALLVLGAVAGWRAGFLAPVLGLAGAVVAFGLGLALASALHTPLTDLGQPVRALVALIGFVVLVSAGETFGGMVGAAASRRLQWTVVQPLDRAGGALVGVAHVVLFAWILGGMLAAGPRPLPGLASESAVLGAIDDRMPPVNAVAGRLLRLLSESELPSLFGGLEPPPAGPVELPDDARSRALARSAVDSTAKVGGAGCGDLLQVGSAFFVDGTHAVTNAHVVAGTIEQSLTLGSITYQAEVVLYDPDHDVAVLSAPQADAPPLELASVPSQRGDTAVALGFPGGGELTAVPAAVTAAREVIGPDIYGEGRVEHSILELRAEVERGDSGGPLVVARGTVGGIVFGESRTADDVGYAISIGSIEEEIQRGMERTVAVDTGPCR